VKSRQPFIARELPDQWVVYGWKEDAVLPGWPAYVAVLRAWKPRHWIAAVRHSLHAALSDAWAAICSPGKS
jgi:hypothetical protein